MPKILGHIRPIGGNRQQGATQPDVVVLLYQAPKTADPLTTASADNITIYCSNISQELQDDYIGVRTHLDQEPSDETEFSAIALYKHIKGGDVIKFEGIKLAPGESIWVYSNRGHVTFTAYGDEIFGVDGLKEKVLNGTASASDKEKLALLTGGVYVIQNNTNNCNCA